MRKDTIPGKEQLMQTIILVDGSQKMVYLVKESTGYSLWFHLYQVNEWERLIPKWWLLTAVSRDEDYGEKDGNNPGAMELFLVFTGEWLN